MNQKYPITFHALVILDPCFNHKKLMDIGALYVHDVSFSNLMTPLSSKHNFHVILIPYDKDYRDRIQNIYLKYPNALIVILLENKDDIKQIISEKYLFFYLSTQNSDTLEFYYHQLWRWILELIKAKHNIQSNIPAISIAGGDLSFATETYTRNNIVYNLTTKQIEILKILLENRGNIVLRTVFLDKIWPTEKKIVTDRVIDTNIVFLRKMLGDQGRSPKYLQTIFGQGYRLNFD